MNTETACESIPYHEEDIRGSRRTFLRQDFDLPLINTDGYKIIGNEQYLEEKKKRPLSLSSIKDLQLVKQDLVINDGEKSENYGEKPITPLVAPIQKTGNVGTPQAGDEKKRLRTLMLASAALAKFRQHATAKRKEKKLNIAGSISPKVSNQMSINEKKRLSIIEVDELFESMVCRR